MAGELEFESRIYRFWASESVNYPTCILVAHRSQDGYSNEHFPARCPTRVSRWVPYFCFNWGAAFKSVVGEKGAFHVDHAVHCCFGPCCHIERTCNRHRIPASRLNIDTVQSRRFLIEGFGLSLSGRAACADGFPLLGKTLTRKRGFRNSLRVAGSQS